MCWRSRNDETVDYSFLRHACTAGLGRVGEGGGGDKEGNLYITQRWRQYEQEQSDGDSMNRDSQVDSENRDSQVDSANRDSQVDSVNRDSQEEIVNRDSPVV